MLLAPVHSPRTADLDDDVQTLLCTLNELGDHLRALHQLAIRKLDAMKRADIALLNSCAAEEECELQRMLRRDGKRDAVLARLAQALRMRTSAPARLTEIAGRLPQPFSSQIVAKSAELRGLAENLEEKNRLAAAVAQSVHSHIRAVFAEVAKANQETIGYGRNGKHEAMTTRAWVDAVG
jgi:hypothetical protein